MLQIAPLPFDPDIDEMAFLSIIRDIEKTLSKNNIAAKVHRPDQLGLVIIFEDDKDVDLAISRISLLVDIRGFGCSCVTINPKNMVLKFKAEDLRTGLHPQNDISRI